MHSEIGYKKGHVREDFQEFQCLFKSMSLNSNILLLGKEGETSMLCLRWLESDNLKAEMKTSSFQWLQQILQKKNVS